MTPNGSDHTGLASAPSLRLSKLVFDRMNRHIGKLGKDAASGEVHRFRTNGRRLEAMIAELTPESRNRKKLLKLMGKLRKKAGKLRDLDVEITFLQNFKIPDRQNHRTQLLETLVAERSKRSRKLQKTFDSASIQELRKRLRRARTELKLEGVNPFQLAVKRLPNPTGSELSEKAMHTFRIDAKRSRYLAEIVESSDASRFVEELKRAQDAIGEWHDLLKLKQKAAHLFGGVHDSALVAALENISRARFRRARTVLMEVLANVSRLQEPVGLKAAGRVDVDVATISRRAAVA